MNQKEIIIWLTDSRTLFHLFIHLVFIDGCVIDRKIGGKKHSKDDLCSLLLNCNGKIQIEIYRMSANSTFGRSDSCCLVTEQCWCCCCYCYCCESVCVCYARCERCAMRKRLVKRVSGTTTCVQTQLKIHTKPSMRSFKHSLSLNASMCDGLLRWDRHSIEVSIFRCCFFISHFHFSIYSSVCLQRTRSHIYSSRLCEKFVLYLVLFVCLLVSVQFLIRSNLCSVAVCLFNPALPSTQKWQIQINCVCFVLSLVKCVYLIVIKGTNDMPFSWWFFFIPPSKLHVSFE